MIKKMMKEIRLFYIVFKCYFLVRQLNKKGFINYKLGFFDLWKRRWKLYEKTDV